MNLRWLGSLMLCCVFLVANSGPARADGWFGTSKPAANGVTTSGPKKSWWPSWPTSKSAAKPKAKTSSKSMWGSVTTGTKNTWNKTTSFLNPFDNPPKPAKPGDTGANSGGWFSSNKPEKTETATLQDFMTQERPKW